MNADVAKQWVAALRSGKYRQNIGSLRSPCGTKYCVLGVLADVLDPNSWTRTLSHDWAHDHMTTQLGLDVSTFAGFTSTPLYGYDGGSPMIRLAGGYKTFLSSLNDHYGWSFAQLADLIENRWSEL